jgi:hypothetical protein
MWKCHKETPCIATLNRQKYHFFSFTKLENGSRIGLAWGGRWLVAVWEGRSAERAKEVNMVQILCTHVCKCKNDACRNCSRNGRREIKGMMEGVNSNMIYLIN